MVQFKGVEPLPADQHIRDNRFNIANEQSIVENSSLKDVMDNLDRDVMDAEHMTSIDFNTRLTSFEIPAIVGLQMMNVLKVGGSSCSLITRTIKRHKVSLMGQGRKEKVDITRNEREAETGGTNLFKSMFGGMKNEKQ